MTVLDRVVERVALTQPRYARKLTAQLAKRDPRFFERADRFLGGWDRLDYAVDCHLKLCESMKQERIEFLRTGRYANTSFAEVERSVYANPEVMEYHMYGLVLSQFLWPEQYARLEFFCDYVGGRERIESYLEIGGGHGMYIASAAGLLRPGTRLELIDISPTSMALAQTMARGLPIEYHLADVFDFPETRKYDLIVAGEVLEHLEDPGKLLAKIRALLADDGRLFISTPVNAPAVDHIYLFEDVGEIRDLLRAEGFRVESETACYAEDLPEAQARKLRIPQMYAAACAMV